MRWLHVMLDVPADQEATSSAFWSQVLGWALGSPWSAAPAIRSFEAPDGDAYVHRQVTDHGPGIHLDLEVEDRQRETERLHRLGATVGERHPRWQVMASPGGLPFCLVDRGRRTEPPAMDWGGHRSRLVQVCIDSPDGQHKAEVDFWRQATQGRWEAGDSPEFAGKLYPDDGPVQLLLQRLEPDSGVRSTTAHLDLGTDDLDAEVDRVLGLGAERLCPGRGWVVLRDPAGMTFCVTGNPPDGARRSPAVLR